MKTCEICGQAKDDVMTETDPYALEVNDVSIPMDLCDHCYGQRIQDI